MASEAKSERQKPHANLVITGHVDSGKSTSCSRLIYELGGVSEREMDKLTKEADAMGKGSFKFAFLMDKTKDERERGITISCTTKEFFTSNYHYTIIDAPGHASFLKNFIAGSSQADVGVLMVPAEGGFTTAIAAGDRKSGEIQGQTRQHARLLNLLGVKQLIVCVNKMDDGTVKYGEARFNEVRDEMRNMLKKVGWPKDFVDKSVAVLPISGWVGDNLIKKSENMPWWRGVDVVNMDGKTIHVETLHDALDKFVTIPKRKLDAPLRMPLSGCFKIKGVGDVITGRVEQGVVKAGDEVIFLPKHTSAKPCTGKVFSVEMHHKQIPQAGPGDNVGLNIKGLEKGYMPDNGDVMVLKSDTSIKPVARFTAQVQLLDVPNEIKVGYTPVAFARTAKCAARIVEIKWGMGKDTGGQKVENPLSLKANMAAECVFEPQQPFVVEPFALSEGLGRVALLEGNTLIMLGKVTAVTYKEEASK